jgi:hypothetical protein
MSKQRLTVQHTAWVHLIDTHLHICLV